MNALSRPHPDPLPEPHLYINEVLRGKAGSFGGLEFFFWFNCMWPVTYKAKEKNKLRASRPSQPACTINTSSVPLANYNSLNLKSYLAGLFEGDGHI